MIAAELITSADVKAVEMRTELDDKFRAAGIATCFAELKDSVKDKLKRSGLFERFDDVALFPTIEVAVES